MHVKVNPFFVCLGVALALGVSGCTLSSEKRALRFLEAGRQEYDKKEYSRAFLLFKNASTADPKNPEPPYRLGLTYMALGDAQSALSYFRKALDLNPRHADAQIRLSEVLALQGDQSSITEAQDRLRSFVGKSPDNADALLTLAFAEGQLGNLQEAERLLLKAVGVNPAHTDALIALARLRIGRSDLAAAEETLRSAASGPSPSADAVTAFAELLLLTGRSQEAEAQLNRALQINPASTAALRNLAKLRHQAGRTQEAADLFKALSTRDAGSRTFYALYLAETGRKQQAITELERLHKADRSDRNVRNMLIGMHFSAGSAARAEELLDSALRTNPKDIDGRLQRSVLHLRRRDLGAAERDVAEVLRLRPDSAYGHFVLSRIYAAQGTLMHQRQELAQALQLNPALLSARLELVQALMTAGQSEQALEVINQAPDDHKAQIVTIEARNRVLLTLGNREALRAGITEGLAIERSTELLLQDAFLRMYEGDRAASRASMREALRQSPEDERVLQFLSRAAIDGQHVQEAIQDVRQQLDGRSSSAPLHHTLGQLLARANDLAAATASFERALTLNPGYLPARLALAQLAIHEKNPARARELLASVPDGNSSAQVRMLLAELEHTSGNDAAAIEHYRHAAEYEPTNVVLLNNLASLLADAGKSDEALKYAQQARDLAPDDPGIADTLGWVLYQKGDFRKAADLFEYAVSRGSTPTRNIHLGLAYVQMGNQERGRALLRAAVRQTSDIPEARLARHALQEQ